MKKAPIYEVIMPSLSSIQQYFKKEYGFTVSPSAAIKYCLKQVNLDYFKPLAFERKLGHKLDIKYINIDNDADELLDKICVKNNHLEYKRADILSALVLHINKLLNG